MLSNSFFYSSGKLIYNNDPYKLIVEIDSEIVKYYRSLVPKYIKLNQQRYAPHISVVRKKIPPIMSLWGKHEGRIINFQYENIIYNNDTYYWLNVISPDLESIREELGLSPVSETTRSPDGIHKFHTTIGNTKNI